jgi:DNA-binding CsgD family transcriptional regulator
MELLERASFVAKLRGLFGQAEDGRGSLVSLRGEAGVGKLALVGRFVETLGARPEAAQGTRRLRELGVRQIPRGPRPATKSHPAGLTSREAEPLALVAEGRSNAEIATSLFFSPKTVEHHVSAVRAKLGVDSRDSAVRVVSQNGHGAIERPALS